MTLIAEDLLLLLLDDDSGKLTGTYYPDTLLGGALLVELALTGAVEVRAGATVVATGAPPQDPQLRAAYDVVAAEPRPAPDLLDQLGEQAHRPLADRLVERGILERVDGKVLGLFRTTRWPTADAAHEREVRRALSTAVVRGVTPDARTAALVALLSAADAVHRVVDHEGLPARELRERARAIAEGAWAAQAVQDAISASITAVATRVAAGSAVVTAIR